MSNKLRAGDQLKRGQRITSTNGLFFLALQGDGNVVLYWEYTGDVGDGDPVEMKPLWATDSDGKESSRFVLQDDGNLVLYDKNDKALWDSGTDGKKAEDFIMQNDGNAVLYDSDRRSIWHTNTMIKTYSASAEARCPGEEWQGSGFAVSFSRSKAIKEAKRSIDDLPCNNPEIRISGVEEAPIDVD